jgi:hypothetical protein
MSILTDWPLHHFQITILRRSCTTCKATLTLANYHSVVQLYMFHHSKGMEDKCSFQSKQCVL